MKVDIIRTKAGETTFHLFEKLPERLYPSGNNYYLQHENINAEFIETAYIALAGNQPQGRLVLYYNPRLLYNGLRAFCIGNYECVEDSKTATILLNAALSDAKRNGAEYMIGPMNGSTWDSYRFSTHHHSPPFLLEQWHHLYYNQHFLSNGFEEIARYISSIDREMLHDHPDTLKREKELTEMGLTLRNIDLENYEQELHQLFPFVTAAFKTNFLYTPIQWETFRDKYLTAKKIINPEYVLIAEDEKKNIVGFIFCYDDLYNRQEKSLVIKTLARAPDKKWSGLGHVMANKIIKTVKNKGYVSVIHALMLEQGYSTGASQFFLGEIFKNYSLYGKKI